MYHIISQTQEFSQQCSGDKKDITQYRLRCSDPTKDIHQWLSENVDDIIDDIFPLDEIDDRLQNTRNTPEEEEEFVLNEDQSSALEKKPSIVQK